MTKQRKNGRGFSFEGKIDLAEWDFNRLDWQSSDAFDRFREDVEKGIEKAQDRLVKSLGRPEQKVRKIASEVFQIVFEREAICGFWSDSDNPQIMTILFSDISEDGYTVELDIKKAIHHYLLQRCDKDGFVSVEEESSVIRFAMMLDDISHGLKTAIRPKENS